MPAAACTKCNPEESVIVGDRIDNNIIPANIIGMKTVWINQGLEKYYAPISAEEEEPNWTVSALSELIYL